jgi:hypothetical protein
MDLRTGARVRRFESVEIGAVAVIVLASVVQSFFLYRLVPVIASLYAGAGETLSLRLRVYIGLCNWALILVPMMLVVWIGFQIAGRPLPATIRRRVLMVLAALAGPVTIAGLYFIAEDSLLQAMRLSSLGTASSQVFERDLLALSLASGNPDQVIASLDPKVSREDFVTNVGWGAPGQAFQLAEAYRAKGDLPAARHFYLRAQQAAVAFDEVLTPQLMDRQARWQAQFGTDFDFWLPKKASDVNVLPDRIRAVSQQRLDQLSK